LKEKNETSNNKLRTGNIQSIMFAIELGYKAVLSNDPAKIKAADKVIFPV
jgi:imidazoleglycerol phosphate synthase glutamine amidotransferase subunit HisH